MHENVDGVIVAYCLVKPHLNLLQEDRRTPVQKQQLPFNFYLYEFHNELATTRPYSDLRNNRKTSSVLFAPFQDNATLTKC